MSPFLLLSSRYTGGTLCSVRYSSYRALVSDPSLVNTTFTATPTFFHGGNTGSNPVGDANNPNDLLESDLFAEGLKGFDKKKSLPGRLLFPRRFARHENHFDKLCLRCALRRSDSLGVRVCSDLVVRVT